MGIYSRARPTIASLLVYFYFNCRRTMLSVVFMIKLINGDIDSSFLLSRINFHIPSRNLRMFATIKMNNYRSIIIHLC